MKNSDSRRTPKGFICSMCNKFFASTKLLNKHLKRTYCGRRAETRDGEIKGQQLNEPSRKTWTVETTDREHHEASTAGPSPSDTKEGTIKDHVIEQAKGLVSLSSRKRDHILIRRDGAAPVVAQSLNRRAKYNNMLAEISYGRAYCLFALVPSCFPAKKRIMQEGEEDIYQHKKSACLGHEQYYMFYTCARLVDSSTCFPVKVMFFSKELDGIPPALAKDSFAIIGIDHVRISLSDDDKYISVNDNSSWAIFTQEGKVVRGHLWKNSKKYVKYLKPIIDLSRTFDKTKFASRSELYVYDDPNLCPVTTTHDPQTECKAYFELFEKLNPGQREALTSLTAKAKEKNSGLFFLDGPAGSGKSSVLKAFISYCYGFDIGEVVVIASTGMVASLYHEGRTAHSALRIPLEPDCDSICKICPGTLAAARLKTARVLAWDECVFHEKYALDAADKGLQKFFGNDQPFGGLFVIFAGDFRQILPITENGQAEEHTIKQACFWNKVKMLFLKENMRAKNRAFADLILNIGNGDFTEILVPEECRRYSLNDLINAVFPKLIAKYNTAVYENKAILSARNKDVDEVNNEILALIPVAGRAYAYRKTERRVAFGIIHVKDKILVKIGCPYMILKNVKHGVYNGTRGVCVEANEDSIKLRITTGVARGEIVVINRVQVSPTKAQFPITPCFAITINKSQGQTLDMIGIYLPVQVFAHGQLYVALSRVGSFEQIVVFSTAVLKNFVIRRILQ